MAFRRFIVDESKPTVNAPGLKVLPKPKVPPKPKLPQPRKETFTRRLLDESRIDVRPPGLSTREMFQLPERVKVQDVISATRKLYDDRTEAYGRKAFVRFNAEAQKQAAKDRAAILKFAEAAERTGNKEAGRTFREIATDTARFGPQEVAYVRKQATFGQIGAYQDLAKSVKAANKKAEGKFSTITDEEVDRILSRPGGPEKLLELLDSTKKGLGDFESPWSLKALGEAAKTVFVDTPAKVGGELAERTPGLDWLLRQIAVPQEQLAQAYYAAALARDEGRGTGTQLNAFLAGMPGLGFLSGGPSREYVERTNSFEERQKLTEEGYIGPSGSRQFLHSWGDQVINNGRANVRQRQGDNWVSGLLDFGFQVATDPFTYIALTTGPMARVGQTTGQAAIRSAAIEAIDSGLPRASRARLAITLGRNPERVLANRIGQTEARALAEKAAYTARAAQLERTSVGLGLSRGVEETLTRSTSVRGLFGRTIQATGDQANLLKRSLGLSRTQADEVVSIARTEGNVAARRAVEEMFRRGEWSPSVTIRRQLVGKAGDLTGSARLQAFLGRAVSANSVPLAFGRTSFRRAGNVVPTLVEIARGRGVRGVSQQGQRLTSAAAAAVDLASYFVDGIGNAPDVHATLVAPKVAGLSTQARWNNVLRFASDNPTLMEAVEGAIDQIAKGLDDAELLAQRMEGAQAQRWLNRFETLMAMLSGDMGANAQKVARETFASAGSTDALTLRQAWTQAARTIPGTEQVAGGLSLKPIEFQPTLPGFEDLATPIKRAYEEAGTDALVAAAVGGGQLSFADWARVIPAHIKAEAKAALSAEEAAKMAARKAAGDFRHHLDGPGAVEAVHSMARALVQAAQDGDVARMRSIKANLDEVVAIVAEYYPEYRPELVPSFSEYRAQAHADVFLNANRTSKGNWRKVAADRLPTDEALKARYTAEVRPLLEAGMPIRPEKVRGFPDLAQVARANRKAMAEAALDQKVAARLAKERVEQAAKELAAFFKVTGTKSRRIDGWSDEVAMMRRIQRELLAMPASENTPFWQATIRKNIIEELPVDLHEILLTELDRVAEQGASGKLRPLYDKVQRLLTDDQFRDEFSRVLATRDAAVAARVEARNAIRTAISRNPYWKRISRGLAESLLAFFEEVTPSVLPTKVAANASVGREVQRSTLERLLNDLGADGLTKRNVLGMYDALPRLASGLPVENDLKSLVRQVYREMALYNGVDGDEFVNLILDSQEARIEAMRAKAKFTARKGSEHAGQVGSQAIDGIPLIDGREFKSLVRKAQLAAAVDTGTKTGYFLKHPGRALRAAGASLDSLPGTLTHSDLRASKVARRLHRFWKFAVVTNLPNAAIGAAGGYIYGREHEGRNPWKDALAGAAIGSLGFIRYVAKVAGVEERLRYGMERGFRPTEWIPGVSKRLSQWGIPEEFRLGALNEIRSQAVSPGNYVSTWRRAITFTDNEWVVLNRKNSRFLDAWGRIVNQQWNIETDAVAELITRRMAGELTESQLDDAIRAFLGTPDGRLWYNRTRGLANGPKSIDEAVERYRQFAQDYLVSPDLAQMRLATIGRAEVGHSELKRLLKQGLAPDAVHAQRVWTIPRTFRQMTQVMFEDLPGRFVMGGPTAKMNREPFARWIFRDEYQKMVRTGVAPERAAQLAEERAIARTNRVMVRIEDESRSAQRLDFLFPFQQPREEMIRTYARLALDNKGRTLQFTRLGALAMNNGSENGMFGKDDFTGRWYLNVPGSARLSQALFGTPQEFRFDLANFFFFGQSLGDDHPLGPAGSVMPVLGGPFATVAMASLFEAKPEWYINMPDNLRTMLFPFGVNGTLLRPESRRLWFAMTQRPAPWDFASRDEAEREIATIQVQALQTLVYLHQQEHPGDIDWAPTEEELDAAVRGILQAQVFFGSIVPSTPRLVLPYREHVAELLKAYDNDYIRAVTFHPELVWYTQSTFEYTGPGSYEEWAGENMPEDWRVQRMMRERKYKTAEQYLADVRDARREALAWREFGNILADPDTDRRQRKIDAWNKKYPDYAKKPQQNYFKQKELAHILSSVPVWKQQAAIDKWRVNFDVSYREYLRIRSEIRSGQFKVNPWKEARPAEKVIEEVERLRSKSGDDEGYIEKQVRQLPIVEQIHYWRYRMDHMSYHSGDEDPERIQAEYRRFKGNISAIYAAHPELLNSDADDEVPGEVYENARQAAYDNIEQIRNKRNDLYKYYSELQDAEQWDAAKAVYKQIQALYTAETAAEDSVYQKFPDLKQLGVELASVVSFRFGEPQFWKRAMQNWQVYDIPFLPTYEEAYYLNAPPAVQQSYIDDLLADLSIGDKMSGHKRWSYLTQFQKDLVMKNAPELVDTLKWSEAYANEAQRAWDDYYAKVTASVNRWNAWKAGGRKGKPPPFVVIPKPDFPKPEHVSEQDAGIAWLLGQFKQYDKRIGKAPAGLDYYLSLEPNTAQRENFLKKNPDVKKWLNDGPFANMPPYLRYVAFDVLRKFTTGDFNYAVSHMDDPPEKEKSSGGGYKPYKKRKYTPYKRRYYRRSYGRYHYGGGKQGLDLSWAFEQLKFFNLRGAKPKPATYDVWVNMPTGVAKAQYIRDHPEIRDWLRLGPMANMPEAYREVVRDIMLKYGKWTEKVDPLSQVITEFYATPSYAKEKFLQDHPELLEYWAALRSPEEEAQYALADQYFSIADPSSRRLFLAGHPELQEWFLNRREQRYETFLNRVAVYMGSNPQLFEHYLQRQTDILAELLRKFGEVPMLTEVPHIKAVEPKVSRHRDVQ